MYRIGDVITGKVTGIQPYGAFVALDAKTQGLIHISECQHGFVDNINDLFTIGEKLRVLILDVDEYSGKISLSLRALQPRPAANVPTEHKHYWTNYHIKAGFRPIAESMPDWLEQAAKDF